MCIKHFNYLLDIKSEKQSVLEIRSHASWYLKGIPNSNELKNKIFKSSNKEEIIELLSSYTFE
jgi:tRNA-dihydrouridine synthase